MKILGKRRRNNCNIEKFYNNGSVNEIVVRGVARITIRYTSVEVYMVYIGIGKELWYI